MNAKIANSIHHTDHPNIDLHYKPDLTYTVCKKSRQSSMFPPFISQSTWHARMLRRMLRSVTVAAHAVLQGKARTPADEEPKQEPERMQVTSLCSA